MIESLAKKALGILRTKCELPKSGLLAGGSIANVIWQLHSGKPAVINDIDVFVLNEKTEIYPDKEDTLYKYEDRNRNYFDNGYSHIIVRENIQSFYSIISSESDGLLNIVKYNSSTDNPMLILNSFDLNCVQVGYSIEEDKFYWTKDFEEFIKTAKIKIVNADTPAHSVIRLVKKSDELNIELDLFEIEILSYLISNGFKSFKTRFKKRYYDIFIKYKEFLEKFFYIERDYSLEEYLKLNKNIDTEIFYLRPTQYFSFIKKYDMNTVSSSKDFLFFIRNISGDENKIKIWNKLYYFFNNISYIDGDVSNEDLELLFKITRSIPNSIEKLKGMTITEQINLIKKLIDVYSDDPIVAICLLENKKIDKDLLIDDDLKLLLELSVRKQIVSTKINIDSIFNDTGFKSSDIF
jgi:hypothetical protein